MKGNKIKKLVIVLFIQASLIGAVRAISNNYVNKITSLSDEILFTAEELQDVTDKPAVNSNEIEEILTELKGLIKEYENTLVFAESPYPGEILLGTTPPGDSIWLETLCSSRYDGLFKEIRIRRTGYEARYLRINDVEITYTTSEGPSKEVFNKNGRVRLYRDGVFKLALPKPMRIRRIRININHESTGLEIYGIPYESEPLQPKPIVRPRRNSPAKEVLLGTTPPGNDSWLETLCNNPNNRPIKEIQLKRTGRKASYLRINDIEVTYMTPAGPMKEVFNKSGRAKLYYDSTFSLILPRSLRVTRIRILTEHESTGLRVYGVY